MWKNVTLEDVCTTITDGSHFSPKTLDDGIPYITVRDVNEAGINFDNCKYVNEDSYKELHKNGCAPSYGDVLFSKDGTVGKVAIVDTNIPFVVLSSLAILTPNQSVLSTAYLSYVLKSPKFLAEAIGKKTGVAIRRIILKNLKKIQFSLPPLAEQQRIVAKLDAAFAEIDGAIVVQSKRKLDVEKLIAKLQNQLFEKASNVNLKSLKDVSKFENGDRGKNYPSKKYQIEEGIPFVNAGDFSLSGEITFNKMVYISEERFNLLGAGKFTKNDILFCLRGSLGKSALNQTIETGAIASSLVIIRADESEILPDYLFAFLRSDIVKGYIDATAGGAAQPNLSAKVVSNYKIPLSDLDEQRKIVKKYWSIRKQGLELQAISKQKISALSAMKSAILAQELQSEAA